MANRRRRHFPENLKRQAVERVVSRGKPIVRIAAGLGVHETLLRRWMKQTAEPGTGPARRSVTQAQGTSPADLAAENARLKRELSRAPMERDIFKESRTRLRDGQPISYQFVDEHRSAWPIHIICRVLSVSPSGYNAWRRRPESERACADRALLSDIHAVHAESGGAYGALRFHAHLRARGRHFGRHRIARLMRRGGPRGLAAIQRRVRTTDKVWRALLYHDYADLGSIPTRLRGTRRISRSCS